jgi:tetratricopeptide (TPR) repeat protein
VKRQKFIALLVVAAGLLAYHNSYTGPFIFDDVAAIKDNPTIRHLWPIWQTLSPPHTGGATVEGRPLVNLSFAINHALGGYNVGGYHALNLTIHILAALTLFGIVRRTLLQPRLRGEFGAAANGLALATAALWTVHPLQTESVTYIVQRAESLMGLFYLLTLYCFIRAAELPRPRAWYGLCVSACALGMASKEVMASAPLMVLLYDRTFLSGSLREAWRRRRPLYLALASTWILLGYLVFFTGSFHTAAVVARSNGIAWWEYLLTEPGVVIHYLRLSVWPHPLCFDDYGWPTARTWTSILPPALVTAILLGASVGAWKTNSVWGFLSAWFFLILAPSSSFIPTDSPAYEHRMYLPLAAVLMLGVLGIHALVERRTVVVVPGGFMRIRDIVGGQHKTWKLVACGAAGMVVLVLTILTIQRNNDYRSEFSIWQDTVVKCPQNPRAHSNLGLALFRLGRTTEGIAHYEQALRIMPDSAEAHNNLGIALKDQGKLPEAIAHYEQALRIKPEYAEAHNNLGNVFSQEGQVSDAIGHYEQALRIEPEYAEAHNNLGNIFLQEGQVSDAIGHYEQALRIKPEYAEAHNNLGLALAALGRLQEAMGHWEHALQIKPDFAEAHYNLGLALVGLGRPQEAMGHWQQALRIKPDFTQAQNALARLQAGQ